MTAWHPSASASSRAAEKMSSLAGVMAPFTSTTSTELAAVDGAVNEVINNIIIDK
jgi:hypothetical protein